MTRTVWLWPALIMALALGSGLLTFSDSSLPLRPVLVLGFLLVGPGMSLLPLLRIRDALTELTLGIALSLALDASVAAIMLYAGAWSPQRSFLVLIGISCGGVLLQVIMAYRRPVASANSEEISRQGDE